MMIFSAPPFLSLFPTSGALHTEDVPVGLGGPLLFAELLEGFPSMKSLCEVMPTSLI